MKKLTFLFGLAVVFVLVAVVTVSAEPAHVYKFDMYLWAFDGNGSPTFVPVSFILVDTNSDGDQTNVSIHGTMPDGVSLPENAVHFETYHMGFLCTGTAPYWKYTLTPSGNFRYHCSSQPFPED